MNRARRRAETRRNQREAQGRFHPRGLARAIVHSQMSHSDMSGVNKVHPGTTQSAFAQGWRKLAERFASAE